MFQEVFGGDTCYVQASQRSKVMLSEPWRAVGGGCGDRPFSMQQFGRDLKQHCWYRIQTSLTSIESLSVETGLGGRGLL